MIPEEFKDMRPFEPEELPAVYDSLLADPMFRAVVGMVMPQIPAEALGPMMHGCKTILEFQYTFIRPLLDGVIKKCTTGLTDDFASLELSKEKENYTYISKSRDGINFEYYSRPIIEALADIFNVPIGLLIGDESAARILMSYDKLHTLIGMADRLDPSDLARLEERAAFMLESEKYTK